MEPAGIPNATFGSLSERYIVEYLRVNSRDYLGNQDLTAGILYTKRSEAEGQPRHLWKGLLKG